MAREWRTMLARSFDPRDWFGGGGGGSRWYYRREDSGRYSVGLLEDGQWYPNGEEYATRHEASARIRQLNTGGQLGMA